MPSLINESSVDNSLREGNSCAHWLVKFGANLDTVFNNWSPYPPQSYISS